jgi:hypothetical protein
MYLPPMVVRLWSLADSPAVASTLHTQYLIWWVITFWYVRIVFVWYLGIGKRFCNHVCSPYELSVVAGNESRRWKRSIPGWSQMDQVLDYNMDRGLKRFFLPGMMRFFYHPSHHFVTESFAALSCSWSSGGETRWQRCYDILS